MASPRWMTAEFIRQIPKTDLHVHLDGSLRLETLIALARSQKLALPSFTPEGLREIVYKPRYNNLEEYLRGFQYTCAVMRNPEALEQISFELAMDNFAEGVRYIEPRFAPQLCATDKMDIEEVLVAVDRGLSRAKREINKIKEIRSGKEPSFDYAIIGCAMRKFGKNYSPYYDNFINCHRFTPEEQIFPLASLELARALVDIRNRRAIPITGFDLAGEEKGWPANVHREAFAYAQYHFLKKTVHAGEAYGPTSIFQAITECHANRIGHGTYLFSSELVDDLPAEERESYTEALTEYISSRRITLEVCPTSNLQTTPSLKGELRNHPLGKMIQKRISLTVCTDNRLVSHTTVCREIESMIKNFEVTAEELKSIIIYGFKRSFSSLPYPEKRDYVRAIIDYYAEVEAKFREVPLQLQKGFS